MSWKLGEKLGESNSQIARCRLASWDSTAPAGSASAPHCSGERLGWSDARSQAASDEDVEEADHSGGNSEPVGGWLGAKHWRAWRQGAGAMAG